MSTQELKQVSIIDQAANKKISLDTASEILELSKRQIYRKIGRYLEKGASGLMHQSRGRESNRKLPESFRKNVANLLQEYFPTHGPSHATERLKDKYGITISIESVRKIMIDEGLHIARNRRTRREQMYRNPRRHRGELVQVDGSYHQWFNGEWSTIMLFIDDATSEIFGMFAEESTEGVTQTFRKFIEKNGLPQALYTDRGSVYYVNAECKGTTQFGRMMKELDIKHIVARSPQAKGRVERAFKTMQQRLCAQLKEEGITTMEQAQKALARYLDEHNKKYARPPAEPISLYRSTQGYNLDLILRLKYQRKLNNGRVVKFERKKMLVDKYHQPHLVRRNATVEVHKTFEGEITIWQKGAQLRYTDFNKPKQKSPSTSDLSDLKPWELSIRNRDIFTLLKL